jgi:hypothetical protein
MTGRRDLRFTLVSIRVEDASVMVAGSSTDYDCESCHKAVLVSPGSIEMLGWELVDRILCIPCTAEMVMTNSQTEPVPPTEGDQQ